MTLPIPFYIHYRMKLPDIMDGNNIFPTQDSETGKNIYDQEERSMDFTFLKKSVMHSLH